MQDYNSKNKSNKLYASKLKEVVLALEHTPRNNKFSPHELKGAYKGVWSMDTGLNSNRDRVLYIIDDTNKTIYLYDIGDYTVYENVYSEIEHISFSEFLEKGNNGYR